MVVNLVVPENLLEPVELLGFGKKARSRKDRLYLGALKALNYTCDVIESVATTDLGSCIVLYSPQTGIALTVWVYPFSWDPQTMPKGYIDPLIRNGLDCVPEFLRAYREAEEPERKCDEPWRESLALPEEGWLQESPEMEINLNCENETRFKRVLEALTFFDPEISADSFFELAIKLPAGVKPLEARGLYLAVENLAEKEPKIKKTDDYSPG